MSLECRLHSVVEVGDNKIVLGQVVFLHIADEFVDREKMHVNADALELIGRMHGGGWYVKTTDLFELPRPSYADWLGEKRVEHSLPKPLPGPGDKVLGLLFGHMERGADDADLGQKIQKRAKRLHAAFVGQPQPD